VATLVYSDADGIDRTLAIGHEPIVVGRAQECAIRSKDPRVSRMHARFFVAEGALWVEDLGSSNGIYVGTSKVKCAPVPTGEMVLIGSLLIRLLPPSGTLPPPMGLHGTLAQWLELERKTRSGVEEERDGLAMRLSEMHGELRLLREELERVREQQTHTEPVTKIAQPQAASELERKLADLLAGRSALEAELAQLREKLAVAAVQLHAGDEPLHAEQARRSQVEAALAEAQRKAMAHSERVIGLERAAEQARAGEQRVQAELAGASAKVTEAEQRASEAERRLSDVASADAQVQAARREREEARVRSHNADLRVAETLQRAEESDKRASAADTMAKAMAKDVAEALRRAVDADLRTRAVSRELDGALRRAEAADQREVMLREADQRASKAEANTEAVRAELAAERSSAMALADRKTRVEQELSDARTQFAAVQHQLEIAETRTRELAHQLEQVGSKAHDVELIESELAEARAATTSALATVADMAKRLAAAEEVAHVAQEARAAAEAAAAASEVAVGEARARIAQLDMTIAKRDAATSQRAAADATTREREASFLDSPTTKRPRIDEAVVREAALEVQLADTTRRLAAAQREIDAAENVRQFAASTEREIAHLRRELREGKAKLAQMTLERDRFESQLRDAREDSETRDRRVAPREPDITLQADLGRYTALVARAAELEQHNARLRDALADAQARTEVETHGDDDLPTNVGPGLPLAFAEHLSVLEESIDSLRANMRAASDETAMMAQNESVVAVASAVSQAAEHVERARAALRVLTSLATGAGGT
jgi:hypothetical protein